MPRQPDPSVPPTEPLYRSLSVDDVCNGEVLPEAVDVPRCSFNRSAYSKPKQVFAPSRPSDTGIGVITGAELPGPFERPSGATPYEYVVEDDPNPPDDQSNDAHCEVRLTRQGLPYNKNHNYDKATKRAAREQLAKKLRIYLDPT